MEIKFKEEEVKQWRKQKKSTIEAFINGTGAAHGRHIKENYSDSSGHVAAPAPTKIGGEDNG